LHETREDLERLQALLDDSYAAAGSHLHEVITPERRLSAIAVAERLEGMCLLVVTTVSRDGRPIGGPVDGIFHRGHFYFGSSRDSVRVSHLRRGSAVSATHLPSEEFSVTVHGTATLIDVGAEDGGRFRRSLLDIYLPRFGPEWERFLETGAVYARIDARRMFTFYMPAE